MPQPATVTTFGGQVELSVLPIKPATQLTVLWMIDTFDSAALDRARTDLSSLFRQSHGRPLRLLVLRGKDVEAFGPFASSTRLEHTLADIELQGSSAASGAAPNPPATSPPGTGPVLFDSIIQNANQLGAHWSPVLLVGDLPNSGEAVNGYAQALLTRTFTAQEVRVFLLPMSAGGDGWAALFQSTGGEVIHQVDELNPLLQEIGQAFLKITWTPAQPPAGFVVFPAVISDAEAQPIATALDLADLGAVLPSVDDYALQQKELQQVAEMLQQPDSATGLQGVQAHLASAGKVNPVDPLLLNLEAVYCERTSAFSEAVKAALLLTEVRPASGSSFTVLAHAQLLASAYDKAEAALNHASQLKVLAELLAEDYARVHLGRSDERGALPYLDAALRADGKRQDLWFLEGRTAEHVREPALAIRSYEQGFTLGGVHVRESEALLRLYLSANDPAKAHAFALHTIEAMPASGAPRAEFAQVLEDVKLPGEAMAAWKSALAVQQDMERAHVHIARLFLESGNAKAAEEAATDGLQILPKSADLYLVMADAMLSQGRAYDARSTLEEGAAATGAPQVLSRLATTQDAYGSGAAEAYAKLAEGLEKGSPERLAALKRGFIVALRDDQLPLAETFAALLKSEGHAEYRSMLREDEKADDQAFIPGGREALAFMAKAKKGVPPDKFLAEFAAALVANGCTGSCPGDDYNASIQRYFDDVSELELLGKPDGHRFLITLSMNGQEERKRTEKVLHLLGLELHSEKGTIKIDMGGRKSQAKKQEVVSALGIDEVGMQEAFQAGKPFTFEIANEPAAIYPSTKLWSESFPGAGRETFALQLLRSPQLARLYVSLSGIDRHTLQALLSATSLTDLPTHFGNSISLYISSFAVQGTQAAVPGGPSADPLWTELAGASPQNAGSFFRALLQQPKMLGYFFALSQLDTRHQAFFTASVDRTRHFYLLFTRLSTSTSQATRKDLTVDSSFAELLRSVPLDDKGHVAFPGSPEIWEVAKGSNSGDKNVAKLIKKASRTAAPDVEDAILVRLAETRYKANNVKGSELDNFLAVSRIDAHRSVPLDEESALLLAQHYSDSWEAYPYFSDLPGIDLAGFHSFFDLIERIQQHSPLEQNLELGQLHSLLAWVSILNRRHAIQEAEAARLFAQICNNLGGSADDGKRSLASLGLVREILAGCSQGHNGAWDETLWSCLLGPSVAADSQRVQDYERVLDAQKAPSLETLHAIFDAVEGILKNSGSGKDSTPDATYAAVISKAVASLPSVPIPKHENVDDRAKESIGHFDPEEVHKRSAELSQVTARQKANPNAVQKAAEELIEALEPQITIALAGPVYAFYLRGTDIVVSEDPLLLRKHRYFDFTSSSIDKHRLIQEADFFPTSEGLGSYFMGGFAQFGLAAGRAAGAGWRQGGSGANAMIAVQIAAIRSTAWDRLIESDQRLVSLRIVAAREWIVQSASNPDYLRALSEDTMGLLSLSRRADLLNGIEDRDWQLVWDSITLPDLFLLGKDYPGIHTTPPDASPLSAELRRIASSNDGSRLDIFGRIPYLVMGCSHPHMAMDAPYEEYERRYMPEDLAERTADFKLFLASRADNLGVEPAEAGRVAERLAGKAFGSSQLTDYHDWRSLLAAYAAISNNDLKKALEP